MDIYNDVKSLCESARAASASIARANETQKNKLLCVLSELLCESSAKIIEANALDLSSAESNGVPKAMLDRLMLNDVRIKGIADSLVSVAALDDPIGKGDVWSRPSGLK